MLEQVILVASKASAIPILRSLISHHVVSIYNQLAAFYSLASLRAAILPNMMVMVDLKL